MRPCIARYRQPQWANQGFNMKRYGARAISILLIDIFIPLAQSFRRFTPNENHPSFQAHFHYIECRFIFCLSWYLLQCRWWCLEFERQKQRHQVVVATLSRSDSTWIKTSYDGASTVFSIETVAPPSTGVPFAGVIKVVRVKSRWCHISNITSRKRVRRPHLDT